MSRIHYRIRRLIPKSIIYYLTKNFFGLQPATDRGLGKTVAHNRMVLAARYLKGDGIEIGGLGRRLLVPSGVRVKYVDRYSGEDLRDSYLELSRDRIFDPDIVDDAEQLATIGDQSQDFVIANHVLEHLENPILFFHNASRVLKNGGILFLAIPDKEKTFDWNRPVTTFDHVLRDFEHGSEISREEHFEEYVSLAETHNGTESWKTEEERREQVRKLISSNYSIHFHVWDIYAMIDLLLNLRRSQKISLVPQAIISWGDEVVFVLERRV